MKATLSLVALLLVCVIGAPAVAQDDGLPPGANKALIEENLLVGLASDNLGLQRSCALMLGQIYSERATIPLMAVYRSSEDPELRIAAAWALCRTGTAVGTYLVKHGTRFEEDQKVKARGAWFYNTYVKSGTFFVMEIGAPSVSEIVYF